MLSLKKNGALGQATTEYILLLLIMIFLFKVVASPLLKNLTEWGSKLVGPSGYYSCLMDQGLLPGFAYRGINCGLKKTEALSSLDQDGKGILGDAGSGKSYSSSSSRKSPSSSKKRVKERSSKNKGGEQDSTSSSLASDASSSSSLSSSTTPSSYGGDSKSSSASRNYAGRFKSQKTTKSSTGKGNAGEDDGYYKAKKKSKTTKSKEENYRSIRGYRGNRIPAEEQKSPLVFKEQILEKKGGGKSQKKKSALLKTKREQSRMLQSEEEEPLQFGDFLKYFIILAILIVLFIVIGSQVLEITNKD